MLQTNDNCVMLTLDKTLFFSEIKHQNCATDIYCLFLWTVGKQRRICGLQTHKCTLMLPNGKKSSFKGVV